jgi:PAS domain S-box-containing protein
VTEEVYRSFFQNSLVAFARTTADARLVLANRAMARVMGFDSVEELISASTSDGWHPYADPEERVALLQRLAREDEVRGFRVAVVRKDGSRVVRAAHVRAVRDPDGRITHLDSALTDPTPQRKLEDELLDREALFRQIAEASPVSTIVAEGADERVRYLNPRFTEVLGYTYEDVPDVAHWWPLAYPAKAYRERIAADWKREVDKAIAEQGETAPVRVVVTCKDGTNRFLEVKLTSLGSRHVVFLKDLTEQRRAVDSADLLRVLSVQIGASPNFEVALNRVVQTLCAENEWPIGVAWRVDQKASVLVRSAVYSSRGAEVGRVLARGATLTRGQDGPGLAWEGRACLSTAGLSAELPLGQAIPLVAGDEVVAVIECFLRESSGEEAFRVDTLTSIARQLGALLEIRRTQDALNVAVKRTARLAMAASDLANTPIQTLLFTAALLAKGVMEPETATGLLERSLAQLVQLSALFKRYLTAIQWDYGEPGFDAWDVIRKEVDSLE